MDRTLATRGDTAEAAITAAGSLADAEAKAAISAVSTFSASL